MKEPIVKKEVISGSTLELLLNFEEDAEYFDGHFDGFPILPGVAQIHYIAVCIEKYFNIKYEVSNIKKLKFSNIIRPNQDVFLKAEYAENAKKITFKYFLDDKIFSSGSVILKGGE